MNYLVKLYKMKINRKLFVIGLWLPIINNGLGLGIIIFFGLWSWSFSAIFEKSSESAVPLLIDFAMNYGRSLKLNTLIYRNIVVVLWSHDFTIKNATNDKQWAKNITLLVSINFCSVLFDLFFSTISFAYFIHLIFWSLSYVCFL